MNTIEDDARRYHLLKHWLLTNGYVIYHEVTTEDSEAFVLGADFYGASLEDAVDTLG